MIFEPKSLKVKTGETIRFVVTNAGELEHEFALDNHKGILANKVAMERMPDMHHDDPNSIRLDEGKDGEVVWNLSNSGEFEFACLIPGHYEAGMNGVIHVSSN